MINLSIICHKSHHQCEIKLNLVYWEGNNHLFLQNSENLQLKNNPRGILEIEV